MIGNTTTRTRLCRRRNGLVVLTSPSQHSSPDTTHCPTFGDSGSSYSPPTCICRIKPCSQLSSAQTWLQRFAICGAKAGVVHSGSTPSASIRLIRPSAMLKCHACGTFTASQRKWLHGWAQSTETAHWPLASYRRLVNDWRSSASPWHSQAGIVPVNTTHLKEAA